MRIPEQFKLSKDDPLDQFNQNAGGINTLVQSAQMELNGEVLRLDDIQAELLRQALSLMLACIKIRFDAVQYTPWELVQQADVTHLLIMSRLSHYCDPDSASRLETSAQLLINAIALGHNTGKFKAMEGQYAVMSEPRLVIYNDMMAYHFATQLRVIPVFSNTLSDGPGALDMAARAIRLYLCDCNRLSRHLRERISRRQVYTDALSTRSDTLVKQELRHEIKREANEKRIENEAIQTPSNAFPISESIIQ